MAGRSADFACFRLNGQLYHSVDTPWYNSRKAAIILVFMAGRSAGFACSRPNGQLYHSVGTPWYNSRKAAIILVFMAGRSAGFACSRPNGQLYHSVDTPWYNRVSYLSLQPLDRGCPPPRRLPGRRLPQPFPAGNGSPSPPVSIEWHILPELFHRRRKTSCRTAFLPCSPG